MSQNAPDRFVAFGHFLAGLTNRDRSRNKSRGRLFFVLEQDPGECLSQTQRTSGLSAGARASSAFDDPEWMLAQLSRLDLLLRTLVEPEALARLLLSELAPLVGAARAAIYTLSTTTAEAPHLRLAASYAGGPGLPETVSLGEGLIGQCAVEQRKLVIRDVPADHFRVRSALGSSAPGELVLVPVWLTDSCRSVIELAFFGELPAAREALLDRLSERRVSSGSGSAVDHSSSPGPGVSAEASSGAPVSLPSQRLHPSQRSGFWGKLSHELRSPLNSVLVLSQLLSENSEDNLTEKQVAFAQAIHASGNDLLGLVNAISDLSKIETNRLVLEPTEISFENFRAHLERAFEPVARARDLEFVVELGPGLPETIVTDGKRLRQIMQCLLSNAFKFTESGRVSVKVTARTSGWSADRDRLNDARAVLAFAVTDTGVGMSDSEQRSILDVFPPERIESRRGSGASGLGMAISRELARLLGGELRVESVVGSGSTFTLYLPACGLEGAAPEERGEAPSAPASSALPLAASLRGEMPAAHVAAAEPAVAPSPDGGSSARRSGSAGSRQPRDAGEPIPTELLGFEIILVDDDVRSAFALTGMLERQGAAVSHAEDVGEALERLSDGRRASALLIDAELLRAGSEDSIRQILQRCAALPIIALTRRQRSGEGSLAEGSLAGGSARLPMPPHVHQLPKPVDPGQLVSVLRSVAVQTRLFQS
jgi:nitrogen-specific signal transduction histidine kinase